jgi:hypothetical protein
MVDADLILGRYRRVRELGRGISGVAWLVTCAGDIKLASGAQLRRGQEFVAKKFNITGTGSLSISSI